MWLLLKIGVLSVVIAYLVRALLFGGLPSGPPNTIPLGPLVLYYFGTWGI